MEIKWILLLAFVITSAIFGSILIVGGLMDEQRQDFIDEQTQETFNRLNEMQTFILMSETYGDEMACIAFSSKLLELDRTVWNLGLKLDQYRAASEEIVKDPFYLQQKITFNENEIFYMMLLTKLKKTCNYNQTILAYFYEDSAACPSCDDQSFVLTDINRNVDQEISIFSYDVDLNLTSVELLREFYDVDELPCIVIEDETYCGMRDRDFILEQICQAQPHGRACELLE